MKLIKYCLIHIILISSLLVSCSKHEIKYQNGIYHGELKDSLPDGYGSWIGKNTSYWGFWTKGMHNGQGTLTKGKYTYRGGFKNGKYHGVGILLTGSEVLYKGFWKDGKRNGEGFFKDKHNNRLKGLWQEDSLISAVLADEKGTYVGNLNEEFLPDGVGRYTYGDMLYYDGEWKDGKKHGFGFEISPSCSLRVGIWKEDKFKGEILTFNKERIYGIDIARYQHKAPINWDALRIIYLGNLSKKKIKGRVNYPVSFIFIKCTEGETIQNAYYSEDYLQARMRGMVCGSYHFFSIHSEPENQAANFLQHLKLRKGDFPPILDLEPTESEIKKIGGSRELFRRVRIWLNLIEKSTGVKPILYVNQMFVIKHMPYARDLQQKHDIWIARYGEYKPDVKMIIWQIAPDGVVSGIKGDVDINVFNGYRPAYSGYLKKKGYK